MKCLSSRRGLAALSAFFPVLALAALGCSGGASAGEEPPGPASGRTGHTGGEGTGGGATVPPLRAQAIAVGASHTCAIVEGGAVSCWGDGSLGQLGDGRAGSDHFSAYAAAVPGLTGATAIAAGGDTTCAVVPGQVLCWGDGAYGQLGDGYAAEGYYQARPVPAQGLTGAVDITVTGSSACAVLADGSVHCWGRNTSQGWLGFASADCGPYSNGSSSALAQPCETTPRRVPGVASALAVAGGGDHTCALTQSGGLTCWGADSFGQLGDGFSGPDVHDPSPAPVVGVGKGLRVALGASHTCVVTGDQRTLSCWGDNSFGQLGIGTASLDSYETRPVVVPGVDQVVGLSAADRTTCAVLGGGTVRCWGDPTHLFAPTADDILENPAAPTPTPGVSSAVEVRTGGAHACARRHDATVICWGLDDRGQLGNGKQSAGDYSLTPVLPAP